MPVRVAVIDSGVHAGHPHVGSVAGGVAIDESGEHGDFTDRLGHGTAVMAAIKEKAPAAELFAVKVFDRALSTRIDFLVQAIDWAARERMDIANLSLGTARPEHEAALRSAVERAGGVIIVSALDADGVAYWPGSLPGVVAVQVDWTCPREACRIATVNGGKVVRASGLPREIPGVPPSRNLHGVSFAVANVTGLLARAFDGVTDRSIAAALRALESA
jgi:subtilisin family serine protease